MAKMIDVARHAGVSLKTVSRVLNNEPHVQDTLREKVRASVEELGYVPSASARSLRSRRSYCINLISHSLHSTFVHAIQFGALQACQEAGYRMMVSMLDPKAAQDPEFLENWCEALVKAGKPDGVILVPPMSDDPAINAAFLRHDIAIARIGPNDIDDDNTSIIIDDREAAREMTTHLINTGHTRIGFVLGKPDQGATPARYKGYCEALEAAGIELDETLVKPGMFDFESGLEAGDAYLTMPEPPTAVFAANDDMAAGVLVAAHRMGVQVPDHISIVGFDDSEIAEKMWPALTTVRQPLQALGAQAIRVLTQSAAGSRSKLDPAGTCLPYEIVLRQSSSQAPNVAGLWRGVQAV
ncbi:MAG: LacI family DNA-binding transcriptional regulator [Pseudomonadota bacterium]